MHEEYAAKRSHSQSARNGNPGLFTTPPTNGSRVWTLRRKPRQSGYEILNTPLSHIISRTTPSRDPKKTPVADVSRLDVCYARFPRLGKRVHHFPNVLFL